MGWLGAAIAGGAGPGMGGLVGMAKQAGPLQLPPGRSRMARPAPPPNEVRIERRLMLRRHQPGRPEAALEAAVHTAARQAANSRLERCGGLAGH